MLYSIFMSYIKHAESLAEWGLLHEQTKSSTNKIALEDAFDPTPVDITEIYTNGTATLKRALRETLPTIDMDDRKVVLPRGLIAAARAKNITVGTPEALEKLSLVTVKPIPPSEFGIQHPEPTEQVGRFITYASFGGATTVSFNENVSNRGGTEYQLAPGSLLSIAPKKLQKNGRILSTYYRFPRESETPDADVQTQTKLVEVQHRAVSAQSPQAKVLAFICDRVPLLEAYHPDKVQILAEQSAQKSATRQVA